jgi:hypothetical protein
VLTRSGRQKSSFATGQCHPVHHDSASTPHGHNPNPRGDKPAVDRLSYGRLLTPGRPDTRIAVSKRRTVHTFDGADPGMGVDCVMERSSCSSARYNDCTQLMSFRSLSASASFKAELYFLHSARITYGTQRCVSDADRIKQQRGTKGGSKLLPLESKHS